MKLISTPLPGLVLVQSDVFADHRGFFMETHHERAFREQGLDVHFVQDNLSRSCRGTLRGLHYQLPPHAQGKLVRVLDGSVFDVAVDIRKGSPTYGQWYGYTLDADKREALYIPPGFAHGFLVLSEWALFHYKCTAFYAREADRGIVWNDAKIRIKWPIQPDPALLSPKDIDAPGLEQAENTFVFSHT